MSSITRANKTASGTKNYLASSKIKSSEVNADFNTIYDDYNGSINNDNISASAAIAASKLDLSTIAQNVNFTGDVTLTTDAILTGSLNITGTLTADTLTADVVIKTPSLTVDKIQIYSDVNTTPLTTDKLYFKDLDDSSRLKQATIQDVLNLDPVNAQQTVKCWVNFNGTGTVAIRDSFNVDSITDNTTGDYTVFWTTDFANDDYSCVFTAGEDSGGTATRICYIRNFNTGSIRVYVTNNSATATDVAAVTGIAIGDQ